MTFGPTNETWRRLYAALSQLARRSGGAFAFVVDATGFLYCLGVPKKRPHTVDETRREIVRRFFENEMKPRKDRRAAQLMIVREDGEDRYAGKRFGNAYVVGIWFSESFSVDGTFAAIRELLPEIEMLVASLPPDAGPTAGAAKARAS